MAGLAGLGVRGAAQEGHRLWMLNSVEVPGGIDEAALRRRLLLDHGIEIGAGLGPLAGKVWRIGLMGESSRQEHVMALLSALEQIAGRHKGRKPAGDALTTALQSYASCA